MADPMNERTPAEALARSRWERQLDPDHPWYVAWDDISPRIRQEQIEFAERDMDLLDAAGFRVSSKPDDDTRRDMEVPADAHPVRYLFGPDQMFHGDPMDTAHLADPIAINVTWRGGDRWAVERGHGWSPQMVWDDTAEEFVYEPLPSARSDEFKRRTRYGHADAFVAARRAARVLGEVRSDG